MGLKLDVGSLLNVWVKLLASDFDVLVSLGADMIHCLRSIDRGWAYIKLVGLRGIVAADIIGVARSHN